MDYSAMGHLYRWSRVGHNLFYRIHKIVTKASKRRTQLKCISSKNLITVNLTRQVNLIGMSLAHINARSIVNKIQPFQQYIVDKNIDICAITETWIKKGDIDMVTREIPPPGYNILSQPRMNGRSGGGLGIIHKDYITINSSKATKNHNTMEYIRYSLRIKQTSNDICVIYRFPGTSVIDFCKELASEIEENINLTSDRCVYIGDFSIHVDEDNPETTTFNDIMESFNLKNLVSFPTHIHQHTLDLILDNRDNPIVQGVTKGQLLSDHNFMYMILAFSRPNPDKVCKTFRKLRQINHQELRDDIIHELVPSTTQLAELVQNYDSRLKQLLDKHAPVKSKIVKRNHEQPWFNEHIKSEIIMRWKKERQWESDNTEYSLRAFYNQRRYVANSIRKYQKQHYREVLLEHKYDAKAIFKITNKLLFKDESLPLPPEPNIKLLAENFQQFLYCKNR